MNAQVAKQRGRCLAAVVVVLAGPAASADTLYVPREYATIQAAIEAAARRR